MATGARTTTSSACALLCAVSTAVAAALCISCITTDPRATYAETDPYERGRRATLERVAPSDLPSEERVARVVAAMDLETKIAMISGYKDFYIHPVDELGLRPLRMADATMGIRGIGRSTAFPSAIALAAGWNPAAVREVAAAIAEECRAKGIDILLGPGMNIYRVPTCGRNYEYFGEDPFLVSALTTAYIEALQENGVMATAKHYVANNSEHDRDRMSSLVGERALREIYLRAFRSAVRVADVKAIMTAYNPVNGVSCSEHSGLIKGILRDEWGFDGVVMSDWISTYDTHRSFTAGLDLEMPSARAYRSHRIVALLETGRIREEELDEKVANILRGPFELGIYDRAPVSEAHREYGGPHDRVALESAREGIVLLKNRNDVLPFDRDRISTIAVAGPNAIRTPTGAGGSGHVDAFEVKSVLEAIAEVAGPDVGIKYASRLNRRHARNADAVVVCVGFSHLTEHESSDRAWELSPHEIETIREAGRLNPNTVVVINAGGGVETESWLESVSGLIHSFYLGQSAGTAVAEVLFGDVNPSGKLPFTMARSWTDFSTTAPGRYVPRRKLRQISIPRPPLFGIELLRSMWDVEYAEGVFVGYRHFDAAAIEPRFPFGFGLSYTSFEIGNGSVTVELPGGSDRVMVKAEVTVTNTGERAGSETVQLYIGSPRELQGIRPPKELRGFRKVRLDPGESERVVFSLDRDAFSYYDESHHTWSFVPGAYRLMIGNSSRDIAISLPVEL